MISLPRIHVDREVRNALYSGVYSDFGQELGVERQEAVILGPLPIPLPK